MDETLRRAVRGVESGEVTSDDALRLAIRSGMTPGDAVKELGLDLYELTGTTYEGNNSGGMFWTDDSSWEKLEAGGWVVLWAKDHKPPSFTDADGRYFGQLATSAFAPFMSISEARDSFEQLTGLDPYASGCECCGSPHGFF